MEEKEIGINLEETVATETPKKKKTVKKEVVEEVTEPVIQSIQEPIEEIKHVEVTVKIEAPKQLIPFGFAHGLLQGGCKLRRESWGSNKYIAKINHGIMYTEIVPDAIDNINRSYNFTAEDKIATDWYIVE